MPSTVITKKTLSQQVTEQMRAEILQNILPSGSHITIQSIAERYNTSPLPVREAFNVLSGENLIKLVPYKGAVIQPIDRLFFENIYDIMTALEVLSIDSAIKNWNPELEAELIDVNKQISELKTEKQVRNNYDDLNRRFHSLIEQFYNNDQAAELLLHYRHLVQLVVSKRSRTLERTREAVKEHAGLIESLSKGSVSASRAMFLEHAYKARDASLDAIFGNKGK